MGATAPAPATTTSSAPADRKYLLERVGKAAVVQLYADGFRDLPLREKTLVWHLAQAAIAGRDIFFDQRNNLTSRKFVLACTPDAFAAAAHAADRAGARFPLASGETLDALLARLRPMFFDPAFDPTVTSKTPRAGKDILTASSNNLYVGVTMEDLEGFREKHPVNSRLVKRGGGLVEEVYRVGGRYGAQISAIVQHLEAAIPCATDSMAKALRALIAFYQTGDDSDREAYDVAWVQDKASPVDTINGFVEVYLDTRSVKGAWEALVFYVNREKTCQIRTIAEHAQWFEDRMPWDARYRKEGVHFDPALRDEVVARVDRLQLPSYTGFVMPRLEAVTDESGAIADVTISYPLDLSAQMLEYSAATRHLRL